MNIETYKTALQAWVTAQTGLPVQDRDSAGGWQGKAFARLHLHGGGGVGVDWLAWAQDEDEAPGEDFIPTVQGCRALTLSVLVRSRDHGHTAGEYLDRLRTSLQKPSVKAAFQAVGLAFSTAENAVDLDGWDNDRTESVASLDVHLNAVVNERDAEEADSFVNALVYALLSVTAASSATYTVTINGTAYTYTSDTDATAAEIRDGLKALIEASEDVLSCAADGTGLIVTFAERTDVHVSAAGAGAALTLTYRDGPVPTWDPSGD